MGWAGDAADSAGIEGMQERQATREAVTTGVDASMGVARRAAGLKEAQHQARREEREANREKLFGKGQKGKGKDSWNAKVGKGLRGLTPEARRGE